MNVIISNANKDVFGQLDVDVLKSMSGEFAVDEIIQSFSNFFFNRMILDVTAIKDYTDVKNIQKLSMSLDVSKIILYLGNDSVANSNSYKSKLVSFGLYNFTNDLVGLKYLYDHPNSYKDVVNYQDIDDVTIFSNNNNFDKSSVGGRILGIKNATDGAGATSLIYMMKKVLSSRYNVVAIEVNKKDFMFFNDESMISAQSNNLANMILKYKDVDIIFVDLNNLDESSFDSDILYLIEPSTIKLNKMLMIDRHLLPSLVDKKVILNKCLLSKDDIKEFQNESGCRILHSLPPMNDRVDNSDILMPFFEKLGFVKKVQSDEDSKKSNNKFLFWKK